mmetsp:Transcript_13563/g.19402  ORF Transcript_13563/g.19402 Transcript_13563/m.19402 type:complete len:244 (-) Transcript_13563:1446-2177(-)
MHPLNMNEAKEEILNEDAKKEDKNSSLSEYQRIRAKNIERNNNRLKSLGLISALEEKRSNAVAWGIQEEENDHIQSNNKSCDDDDEDWVESKLPSSIKRKRETKVLTSPSRKSLRLQGISVDVKSMNSHVHANKPIEVEREERVRECRLTRLRAAKALANAGGEVAAKENPTATYEHCLMRVKTMSEKGLINRVKAIERASGRHCIVKMAIFKSCLQDEGLWELAELASEALERLKALQPIPD